MIDSWKSLFEYASYYWVDRNHKISCSSDFAWISIMNLGSFTRIMRQPIPLCEEVLCIEHHPLVGLSTILIQCNTLWLLFISKNQIWTEGSKLSEHWICQSKLAGILNRKGLSALLYIDKIQIVWCRAWQGYYSEEDKVSDDGEE